MGMMEIHTRCGSFQLNGLPTTIAASRTCMARKERWLPPLRQQDSMLHNGETSTLSAYDWDVEQEFYSLAPL